MASGGYRISNRVKQKLVDIDNAALIAHDIVFVSEDIKREEKKLLLSCCSKIRKIIKEILQEQGGF